MFSKFAQYTADELRECGASFTSALRDAGQWIAWDETEAWTEFVLDWFASSAPTGVLVDARAPRPCPRSQPARPTYGEFLVDLTHSTYPPYPPDGDFPYWRPEYWERALKGPCEVLLALESEWGKCGAPAATRVAVLQDAIKIAALRATAKVVVFGPEDSARATELFGDLGALRDRSKDAAPWLCVALPWSDELPSFRVFAP